MTSPETLWRQFLMGFAGMRSLKVEETSFKGWVSVRCEETRVDLIHLASLLEERTVGKLIPSLEFVLVVDPRTTPLSTVQDAISLRLVEHRLFQQGAQTLPELYDAIPSDLAPLGLDQLKRLLDSIPTRVRVDQEGHYRMMAGALKPKVSESAPRQAPTSVLSSLPESVTGPAETPLGGDTCPATVHLARGDDHFSQERFDEALSDYEAAIALEPKNPIGYYNRGCTFRMLDRYEEALTDLEQALSLDPDYERAYCELAYALSDLEREAEAEAAWSQAIRINPDVPTYWVSRGDICFQQERYPKALSDYQNAVYLDPKSPLGHYSHGRTLYMLERHDEALSDLDRAIALNPDYEEAHGERASVLSGLDRDAEATESWNQAIRLNPDAPNHWLDRGDIHFKQERYPEALTDYEAAIGLDPMNPIGYYNRGYTLRMLERYEEALTDLGEAVSLDPDYENAHEELAYALADLGRDTEATESWDQAIRLNPTEPSYWLGRGDIYFNQEHYPEALSDYDHAVCLDPTSPLGYYNRGCTLHVLERYEEALSDLEQAVSLDPDYEEARSELMLVLSALAADNAPSHPKDIQVLQIAQVSASLPFDEDELAEMTLTDLDFSDELTEKLSRIGVASAGGLRGLTATELSSLGADRDAVERKLRELFGTGTVPSKLTNASSPFEASDAEQRISRKRTARRRKAIPSSENSCNETTTLEAPDAERKILMALANHSCSLGSAQWAAILSGARQRVLDKLSPPDATYFGLFKGTLQSEIKKSLGKLVRAGLLERKWTEEHDAVLRLTKKGRAALDD